MRRWLPRLMLYLSLVGTGPALATPQESEVRAAIVANFINYLEYQEYSSPNNDPLICVAGRGESADALLALDGRPLFGRRLQVISRLHPATTAGCKILFIGDTAVRSTSEWLRGVAGQAILTVSEQDDFLPLGGMIALTTQGHRTAFDINLGALRQANLKLSAKLLRLARELYGR